MDTVFSTTVRMRVVGTDQRLGTKSGLVEVETFALSEPDSIERSWYRQSPDSLVDVAYTSPVHVPGVVPLSQSTPRLDPNRLADGITGLPLLVRRHSTPSAKAPPDTTVREDSRIVLQAPLEQGTSWTSFRSPFLSNRSVTGRSTTETAAGRFETVEIATTLPELNPSLHWSDYISTEGLVKRVVTDTVERRTDEGMYDGQDVLREIYELEEYQ